MAGDEAGAEQPPGQEQPGDEPDRVATLTGVVPGGPRAGAAVGRACRDVAPRSAHGSWSPAPDRPDPIALIDATNATRVPELVPVRWARMLESPFTFYRGAPAMLAHDLASTPTTGIDVQACGDAHLANFGLFGTPERHLVFDVNDFDETLPGPWEWDVKRLAASIVVAARVAGMSDGTDAAQQAAASYRTAMARLSQQPILDVWYAAVHAEAIIASADEAHRKAVEKMVAKARANSSDRAYRRLTEVVDGQRRFIESPPTTVRLTGSGDTATLDALVAGYLDSMPDDRRALLSQYRFVDVARKVVGVGSVGTRCFAALFEGSLDDPLFLQVKEAGPSILEPYVGRSAHATAGRRVVAGQRITQGASDLLLGWSDGGGHSYYVRQLRDMKGGAEIASLDAAGLVAYGGLCGTTLARAHARTGVASQISGYLGTSDRFDRAIVGFSVAYADQNELDHAALVAAVADGRVTASSSPI